MVPPDSETLFITKMKWAIKPWKDLMHITKWKNPIWKGYKPYDSKEMKFWKRLSRSFHFHALEKEMATHSSVLAWRIPGTGEPGGLPSMGSHRVGHDWSDLAAAAAGKKDGCEQAEHRGFVEQLNKFVWYYNGGYMSLYTCPNSEFTTPKMNPKINYEL